MLPITGIQKTTLLDYPGILACTIFLGGCNFRCVFCHNSEILQLSDDLLLISKEDVFAHLTRRASILKGVCITGGEPTLYPELADFIRKIKAMGFLVKLDTNGTNPAMLESLLTQQLLDYIAMDIKADETNYATCCGFQADYDFSALLSSVKSSISIIKNAGIDYEFRTTVFEDFHTEAMLAGICELTNGGKNFSIQNYQDSEHVPNHALKSCSLETLERFKEICSPYFDSVILRT